MRRIEYVVPLRVEITDNLSIDLRHPDALCVVCQRPAELLAEDVFREIIAKAIPLSILIADASERRAGRIKTFIIGFSCSPFYSASSITPPPKTTSPL